MKKLFFTIVFINLVHSQSTVDINNQEVLVMPNEAVVEVFGMVCSFCAYGLEKNLSNLDKINSKKYTNGVYVDIDNQYLKIAFQTKSQIDYKKIHSLIVDAGFTPNVIYSIEKNELSQHTIDKTGNMKSMKHMHKHDHGDSHDHDSM
jgi:copper chaperone CopZ